MRHADRVRMANIAQTVNVLQSVLLTDGPRMVRTPTYYAFLLYLPFQGATALPVQLSVANRGSSDRTIDVAAARATDGQLHVALVNVDPDEGAKVELSLPRGGKRVTGQIVTALQMDSRNRFGEAEEVRPRSFDGARWESGRLAVTMPAKSVVVLTIP